MTIKKPINELEIIAYSSPDPSKISGGNGSGEVVGRVESLKLKGPIAKPKAVKKKRKTK